MTTKLKWLLPTVKVAFVFACKIYEPHQYRVLADRSGVESTWHGSYNTALPR